MLKLKPVGGASKWGTLAAAAVVGTGSLVWGIQLPPAIPKLVHFNYTGGVQTWKVPAGVHTASFTVIGAQGGGGCGVGAATNNGGNGGEVIATIPVTPGQVFQLRVGGVGAHGNCTPNSKQHAPGGFNGGGLGGASQSLFPGGGGGGASDVRHSPYGPVTRDLVGGGGGGGAGWSGGSGGAGGGPVGADGGHALAGRGGKDVAGGTGGLGGGGCGPGEGGTFGAGGNAGFLGDPSQLLQGAAGGGGGGGWNGGGGGGCHQSDVGGGGGGGSSHGPAGAVFIDAVNSAGHGRISISFNEPGVPKSQTFSYTGGVQTWTVPAGVTAATFAVFGAKGGVGSDFCAAGSAAGSGGQVIVTMAVAPGQVFQIHVGGQGANGVCNPFAEAQNGAHPGGAGGFNGGAVGGTLANNFKNPGAGGGGASDVRVSPFALANRVIVAGGGGGSGGGFTECPGGNGGKTGLDGSCGGGGGGEALGAGIPGFGGPGNGGQAAASTLGKGGAGGGKNTDANATPQYGGGGGGGGWYGGGGGGGQYAAAPVGGGGGGSSHGPPGSVFLSGINAGNGYVVMTYLG